MAWITVATLSGLGDATAATLINTATSQTRAAISAIFGPSVAEQLAQDATIRQAAVDAMSDAAVQAQLAFQKANIAGDVDFNTLTSPGAFAMSATPINHAAQNMPANTRGTLLVFQIVGGTSVLQIYFGWGANASATYIRSRNGGTWLKWSQLGLASEALTATSNFNSFVDPGRYSLAAVPTDWAAQNMPANARGVLHVLGMNTTSAFIQTYHTWEASPRLFLRQYASGAFQPWREVGATGTSTGGSDGPGSGMKRVGVPITAGHSGSDAPLEATVRMPMLFGAPIIRWRLRIQDINPRSGSTRAGAINISGIRLGDHTGNGAMANTIDLSGPFTIPDGAVEYKTKWFNAPLPADQEHLLSFGYTKATAPWAMLGYSYQTADDADYAASNPAGMTKLGTAPFSIAIEAETYAHTPVVASLGDSNSVGVGAANGLHDSWLSQLCRRIKALPDHRGSSGDTCINSATTGYKYTRFSDLTKPDAVIMALGQNDIAIDGTTAATVQANAAGVLALLAADVSPTVYAVNYMPRTTDPWAGFEAVRRDVNTWLLTQPGTIRDVFDIAAAISSDDETITPAYDSDGTHLNAAGFGAVQAAINRPVTTPPVQYVSLV